MLAPPSRNFSPESASSVRYYHAPEPALAPAPEPAPQFQCWSAPPGQLVELTSHGLRISPAPALSTSQIEAFRAAAAPAQEVFAPPARDVFAPPARDVFAPPARDVFAPLARDVFAPPARDVFAPLARDVFAPPARDVFAPPARTSGQPRTHPTVEGAVTRDYHSPAWAAGLLGQTRPPETSTTREYFTPDVAQRWAPRGPASLLESASALEALYGRCARCGLTKCNEYAVFGEYANLHFDCLLSSRSCAGQDHRNAPP